MPVAAVHEHGHLRDPDTRCPADLAQTSSSADSRDTRPPEARGAASASGSVPFARLAFITARVAADDAGGLGSCRPGMPCSIPLERVDAMRGWMQTFDGRTATEAQIMERAQSMPGRSFGQLVSMAGLADESSRHTKGRVGAAVEAFFGMRADNLLRT